MGRINTVLFDFDGTVMDTNDVIYNSWQFTYNELTGRDGDDDVIYATFGEPLYQSMEKLFPDVPAEKSVELYRSYHYDHFTDLIRLFPGIEELLAEIKKRGLKTALVTSRLQRTTGIGMRKFGLEKYFDQVVTIEDCTKYKPDPEPINIALERLGSRPGESIMIGDSLFDLQCADNAGVEYAMVGWARAVDADSLDGDEKPEHILDRAEDLLDILDAE